MSFLTQTEMQEIAAKIAAEFGANVAVTSIERINVATLWSSKCGWVGVPFVIEGLPVVDAFWN